jgi:hypothetical protein
VGNCHVTCAYGSEAQTCPSGLHQCGGC